MQQAVKIDFDLKEKVDAPRDWVSKNPRLLEVAQLVAEGNSNGQIAEVLGISPGTVCRHLERLRTLLGLEGTFRGQVRVGITRWWYEVGTHRGETAVMAAPKKVEGLRLYCEVCWQETWHRLVLSDQSRSECEEYECEVCHTMRWYKVR